MYEEQNPKVRGIDSRKVAATIRMRSTVVPKQPKKINAHEQPFAANTVVAQKSIASTPGGSMIKSEQDVNSFCSSTVDFVMHDA